jgi:hypothetical protein
MRVEVNSLLVSHTNLEYLKRELIGHFHAKRYNEKILIQWTSHHWVNFPHYYSTLTMDPSRYSVFVFNSENDRLNVSNSVL